jgi:hypothetical protein
VIALAVTAAVLGELCAPPPPATAARDPAAAARYVEIADAERAAGHARTAATAYRAALARDPASAPARAGLAALCAAPARSPADELAAGLARFRAGDHAAAQAHFAAATRGAGEVGAGAHFFLGVIALRAGERSQAMRELSIAAAAPAYAAPAAELRRLARRQGKLALSVLIAPEWDSNVRLVPDAPATTLASDAESDAAILGVATAALRPAAALSLGGTVAWRRHVRMTETDLVAARGQLDVELTRGVHRLGARGELAVDTVGGDLYGAAQQGSVSYAWEPAPGAAAAARYALRRRAYDAAESEVFSGVVHAAGLSGRVRAARALQLGGELGGGRERTRDPALDAWTAGATLEARLSPAAGLRYTLSGGVTRGWYDGGRRDLRFAGSLDAELDLGDHFALVAGADLDRADSTDAAYGYTRLVVRAGVAAFVGLP